MPKVTYEEIVRAISNNDFMIQLAQTMWDMAHDEVAGYARYRENDVKEYIANNETIFDGTDLYMYFDINGNVTISTAAKQSGNDTWAGSVGLWNILSCADWASVITEVTYTVLGDDAVNIMRKYAE